MAAQFQAFLIAFMLLSTTSVRAAGAGEDSDLFIKRARNPRSGMLAFVNTSHRDNVEILNNPYIVGAYVNFFWSEIERTKGVYDWSVIDSFYRKWITDGGKKMAIRIMWTTSPYWPGSDANRHPTPRWVFEEGAKYVAYTDTKDSKYNTEIPLFWDPIYMNGALRLMQKMAERYDNDPNILFMSATPGYETNPFHFAAFEKVTPGTLAVFEKTKASDGSIYSDELWLNTCRHWLRSLSRMYRSLPLEVSLNCGGINFNVDHFPLIGQMAVSNGMIVGQNGLKESSFLNAYGGRYNLYLKWKDIVPVFQETVFAAGTADAGSMQGLLEASTRINCSYVNVYVVDVLKGTPGSKTYNSAFENALRWGQEHIQNR